MFFSDYENIELFIKTQRIMQKSEIGFNSDQVHELMNVRGSGAFSLKFRIMYTANRNK
jgi:hypothetical protein